MIRRNNSYSINISDLIKMFFDNVTHLNHENWPYISQESVFLKQSSASNYEKCCNARSALFFHNSFNESNERGNLRIRILS